jgi:hypothetical protein
VRMVNREVLPTMGRPIMAVFIWNAEPATEARRSD